MYESEGDIMKKISKKEQLERLKQIAESKNGKLLSTEFHTAKTKYDFVCENGHQFQLTSDKIVSRGDWCPYCAGRYGDFNEKYRKIIEEYHHGKMLSKYIKATVHIKCMCERGHEFEILSSNLAKGKWCPECKISHGENAIKKYLDDKNITYIQQYRFDDLKGKRLKLPFDFAIFDNDKLICVIEYNGEQHYRPMRYSDNYEKCLEKFYETQKTDRLKKEYCTKNNIPLIVISCFDVDYRRLNNLQRDVNEILDNKLSMLISVPSLDK